MGNFYFTYSPKEHVSQHIATSEYEKSDSDLHCGCVAWFQVRFQHRFQHSVSAKGGEKVDERQQKGQRGENASDSDNDIIVYKVWSYIG